jgi:hypothetical protein
MRVTYRVIEDNGAHVRFSLWVNGGLICSPGGLCVRKDEFAPLMEKLGATSDTEWWIQSQMAETL